MRRMALRTVRKYGFTIIEIMVAILLLASSLVAIFGVQFAAVSSASYARNITQATQLARCRMSELELEFKEEGFQESGLFETGECCEMMEGETETEFECEWAVENVTFPDMTEMMGTEDGEGGIGGSSEEMMQSIMGGGETGSPGESGLLGMGDDLATEDMTEMGMDMVAEAMPVITALLEQAIRRVTVRVKWRDGKIDEKFEIVQYVTHPSQGPLKLMQEARSAQAISSQLNQQGGGN